MSYNSYNSEVMDASEMTELLVQQRSMLEQLSNLMTQHTVSVFLSSLDKEQSKRIQEALVGKIINDIKSGNFKFDFASFLATHISKIFDSAPDSMKEPIVKGAMKYIGIEFDEIVDWKLKDKIKEVGKETLDKWISGNEKVIEAKATNIIKHKLESVFNAELAALLLKDLSQKVIQNKFKHILD